MKNRELIETIKNSNLKNYEIADVIGVEPAELQKLLRSRISPYRMKQMIYEIKRASNDMRKGLF